MPRATLQTWAAGTGRQSPPAEVRQEKRKALAEKFEEIAHLCAGLMPGKMADASLVQLATTAGIATDKMLTLRAAGETWKEPEQPIDLSKLTVEQLLTLDGWLPEGSGGQRGAGQADVGEPRPAAGG